MSLGGTDSYRSFAGPVPDLVGAAVEAAEHLDFAYCLRPELGRLLAVLAAGLPGGSIVGETGTGTGAGPGSGKGSDAPMDALVGLVPGGILTVDDFTPMTEWPPRFAGEIDTSRQHWLDHPHLLATEIRVAPDLSILVCRRYNES